MNAFAQPQQTSPDLAQYRLSGVQAVRSGVGGEQSIEIRMPSSAYQDPLKEELSDRDFMAWLPADFRNGTIDVDVLSDLAVDAPAYARGFVGVAFRIDSALRFESIYLRPTNSRADDQVRRNHTIQYAAYPDFRFSQLRRDFPEKYESYADIEIGRWIHMRIVVSETSALLYLDGHAQPALIVKDLKLGAKQAGGVGVWIESGTVARFKNLRISPATD
jgi:hypothetical protein